LEDMQSWCTRHKLTIQIEKTKVLSINRQKFIGPLNELKIGGSIENAAEAKCLGFMQKVKRFKNMEYLPKLFGGDLF